MAGGYGRGVGAGGRYGMMGSTFGNPDQPKMPKEKRNRTVRRIATFFRPYRLAGCRRLTRRNPARSRLHRPARLAWSLGCHTTPAARGE